MSSAGWPSKIVALTLTAKPLRLRGLDRRTRRARTAFHADRLVVMLLDAVEMDREEQVGRGLEQCELLLQQQRVGAQRDELLARHDALDDLADVLVDQRLAARDRHHRRAALVDRVEAFLHREAAIEDRIRIIDLAAAGAGEVAAEQRLQHQHERIALPPHELLLHEIRANLHFLEKRNGHPATF